MLYLLLIVVFSNMSKKWWPFLLIGYGETLSNCCVNKVSNSIFAFFNSSSTADSSNYFWCTVSILWCQRQLWRFTLVRHLYI